MTSPATQLRVAVKAALEAEFAGELAVLDGRMHPAHSGGYAAVYPAYEIDGRNVIDQNTYVVVQVFLPWQKQIDPERVVDPTALEAYVERLRERMRSVTHPMTGTAGLWYFRVPRIDYKTDPTGAITRFEAQILGVGQNFAETTA